MAHPRRDLKKEAFWRDALLRFASGGLSVREFCRRNQLPEASFYERRRTYQERDAGAQDQSPAFIPVVVRDGQRTAHDSGIVIELRGGRILRLPGSMSVVRVAELVRAIEAAEATA